eukprot:9960900-Heterocapsa_arctica.AAC.1
MQTVSALLSTSGGAPASVGSAGSEHASARAFSSPSKSSAAAHPIDLHRAILPDRGCVAHHGDTILRVVD